jgi:hypothetical protein
VEIKTRRVAETMSADHTLLKATIEHAGDDLE